MSRRSLSNRYKPYFIKLERNPLKAEIKLNRKRVLKTGARKYRAIKRSLLRSQENSVETKKKSHHSKQASLDLDKEINYEDLILKYINDRSSVKANSRSSDFRANFKKKANPVKREELRQSLEIEPSFQNEFMRNIDSMSAILDDFYARR